MLNRIRSFLKRREGRTKTVPSVSETLAVSGRRTGKPMKFPPMKPPPQPIAGSTAVRRTQSLQEFLPEFCAHVLASMAEGVSIASEDGIILYTNPAEDAMFGYAPGELIGKHVSLQTACGSEENIRLTDEVIRHP